MDLYKKAEKFVVDSFTKAGRERGIKHFKRTVYWLKKLKPDADEAMLIAAVAHDIERAFRPKTYDTFVKSDKGFQDNVHLKMHQDKGAKIIAEFLENLGASAEFIRRVRSLVSKHEVGGSEDQNVLKDADSVSFFENNADYFVSHITQETSKDKVRDKLDWMFDRISYEKAKQIARPWHKDALKKLQQVKD